MEVNMELNVNIGQEFIIEQGGNSIRQFPFLAAFNNDVFANFAQHGDLFGIYHAVDGMRISRDGGSTWPTYIQNQDFFLSSLIKLNNGHLFGMDYISIRVDAKNIKCRYWKSIDNGNSWTDHEGNVCLPQDQYQYPENENGGFEFHRTIIVTPDGSLQGTMYGKYAGDIMFRVIWVKSIDDGKNWTFVSTVAYDDSLGVEGYCEPVVARCKDNSLLCIMRIGSFYPLYQCRSTDNGLTWSTPTTLQGIDPCYTQSVDPDLCLMTNGILVLSYGRPNCSLLFSIDGNGELWGNHTIAYVSKISEYTDAKVATQDNWLLDSTTSGYTGVREIARNRLLLIGDAGADWSNPENYIIWGKYIDVDINIDM
ncbi:MAG: sialidase family protein [Saccharofermentanales bacterium]